MAQVKLNNNSVVTVPNDILKGIFVEEDLNESSIIPLTFVNSKSFTLLVENYNETTNKINDIFLDIFQIIDILNVATALNLENIINQTVNALAAIINSKNFSTEFKEYKESILNKIKNLQLGPQQELSDRIPKHVFVKQYSVNINEKLCIISPDKNIIITVNESVKYNNKSLYITAYDMSVITTVRKYIKGKFVEEFKYPYIIRDTAVTNNGDIFYLCKILHSSKSYIGKNGQEIIDITKFTDVSISKDGLRYTYIKDDKRIFRSLEDNEIIREYEITNNMHFNLEDSQISPNMRFIYTIPKIKLLDKSNFEFMIPSLQFIEMIDIDINEKIILPLCINNNLLQSYKLLFSPSEEYILISRYTYGTFDYFIIKTDTGEFIYSFNNDLVGMIIDNGIIDINDDGIFMMLKLNDDDAILTFLPYEDMRDYDIETIHINDYDRLTLVRIYPGEDNNILVDDIPCVGIRDRIIYKKISGDLITILNAMLN